MNFTAQDHRFMAEALRLAKRGLWTTDPNPSVGCVIVQSGQVAGRGYTQRPGQPHAEIMALREAGEQANGSTVYTTLEPCSHFGRTPPCADALVEARVRRVISAMHDPNPQINGGGFAKLQAAGIQVENGLMEPAARELNAGFVSRFERGRPWVRAKIAGSVDGRTTGPDGVSQWITSASARIDGHRWRARASAILTGIGTIQADNPRLDVRLDDFQKTLPVIVLDSRARLSAEATIFKAEQANVLQVSTRPAEHPLPCEQIVLPADPQGQVPLKSMLERLAEREISELHVEAGATLTGALLMAGLVDELIVYQAGTLIGSEGQAFATLPGMEKFSQRLHMNLLESRRIGPDWRFIYRPS